MLSSYIELKYGLRMADMGDLYRTINNIDKGRMPNTRSLVKIAECIEKRNECHNVFEVATDLFQTVMKIYKIKEIGK